MTISNNRLLELSVDDIVQHAYRMAGVIELSQSPNEPQKAFGRTCLDTVSLALEAEVAITRQIIFFIVELTAGVSDYTLPEDILDVSDPAMYLDPTMPRTGGNGETLVSICSRDDWQRLSAKEAAGRPFWYLPIRTGKQVVVRLYPVPNEAGAVRFQCHQLRARGVSGSTPDLERYWGPYLTTAVAAELSFSCGMPDKRTSDLRSEAQKLLRSCKGRSAQKVNAQFVLSHRSVGWR